MSIAVAALAAIAVMPGQASAGSGAPRRATCENEAGRLTHPVLVYNRLRQGSEPPFELSAGRAIYLCERRGEWQGVQFPREQERVDCSRRGRRNACPRGWIKRGVNLDFYG